MGRSFILLLLAGSLVLTGCGPGSQTDTTPQSQDSSSTNRKVFQVKGVVVSVKQEEKAIEIKHEEIPGYMGEMTMTFDVKDTNELVGLNPGDAVGFRLIDAGTQGWIEQIRRLGSGQTNGAASTSPVRVLRDVEPLNVGDALPEYHF